MTRSRVLSGILMAVFVIVMIIILLWLKSGLAGNGPTSPSSSSQSYLIETSSSTTP